MITRALLLMLLWCAPVEASPGLYDVTDYGATGDGSADDGPAIRAARDAAIAGGGGNIHLPAGTYYVATPILMQAGSPFVSLRVTGAGSTATRVACDVGSTNVCLEINTGGSNSNEIEVSHLAFTNLAVVGIEGSGPNCSNAVKMATGPFSRAHLHHVAFYGVDCSKSLINMVGGLQTVEHVGLHAPSVPGQSPPLGIIHSDSGRLVKMADIAGTDYGGIGVPGSDGLVTEMVSGACCTAWISIVPPARYDARTAWSAVSLERLSLDEGPKYGVLLGNMVQAKNAADYRGRTVEVRDSFFNANSTTGAVTIYAWNYDHVRLERTFAGWTSNPRDIVEANGIGTVELVNVHGETYPTYTSNDGPNNVTADGTTKYLRIVDSTLVDASTSAVTTEVLRNGVALPSSCYADLVSCP